MELPVSKWGNSLARRIPPAVVRQLGLRDGGTVRAEFMADGALAIRPTAWSRTAFAAELDQARAGRGRFEMDITAACSSSAALECIAVHVDTVR